MPQTRSRSGKAAVLTAIVIAVSTALVMLVGNGALPILLISLPVPLCFLWISVDVQRSDEQ